MKMNEYEDAVHVWGRVWMLGALAVMLAVPVAMCLRFGAWPGLVAPVYWTVSAIEVFTYAPMLGSGGTYLAFVTGNITNLKAPAAINAMTAADIMPGSEKGEVLSTIAIAVTSIVTTIILALGVMLFSTFAPVLEMPVLRPAFKMILPQLETFRRADGRDDPHLPRRPFAVRCGQPSRAARRPRLCRFGAISLQKGAGMNVAFFLTAFAFLAAIFVAVVLVRALLFAPAAAEAPAEIPVSFDETPVTDHLAQMLRIPTVSNLDSSKVDFARFAEFRSLLETLYPTVALSCERELAGATGVLYRWKGKRAESPTVLMAHYDVVPADGEGWTHPPFAGEVDSDGVLWGRGAIDTKITLCGIMEAAELHLKNGFVPENDIYLAFSGDEEIMGPSALAVVDALENRGIRPALVLDEGGAVVANVFPGVTKKCAVIGVTEKGIMNVLFSAKSNGGHSSAPPVKNPVGRLAAAIRRVEDHPFPARLTPASRAMFDTMGRHSSFAYKILFANLWCFFPVLKKICSLTGGELNST